MNIAIFDQEEETVKIMSSKGEVLKIYCVRYIPTISCLEFTAKINDRIKSGYNEI